MTMSASTPITAVEVSAGIIVRDSKILLAQRAAKAHQGGKWEFPGGKLDAGETATQALVRELHEELGISVDEAEPALTLTHDYADKRVTLHVFWVWQFLGEPRGIEGQPVQWVAARDLTQFEFPDANAPIVEACLARFGR